jgi:hypothetical protein
VALELKPGTRLRSAVCEVEAIVVKAPGGEVDVRCGGHPMVAIGDDIPAGLTAESGHDKGSLLGKRYVDDAGTLEILCTKAGSSSLSVGDTPLEVKDAKPLPSSD